MKSQEHNRSKNGTLREKKKISRPLRSHKKKTMSVFVDKLPRREFISITVLVNSKNSHVLYQLRFSLIRKQKGPVSNHFRGNGTRVGFCSGNSVSRVPRTNHWTLKSMRTSRTRQPDYEGCVRHECQKDCYVLLLGRDSRLGITAISWNYVQCSSAGPRATQTDSSKKGAWDFGRKQLLASETDHDEPLRQHKELTRLVEAAHTGKQRLGASEQEKPLIKLLGCLMGDA